MGGVSPKGCFAKTHAQQSRLVHRLGFRRQHAIGNYIADFCCPRKMLIVELDGGQHLEQEEYDAERTRERMLET